VEPIFLREFNFENGDFFVCFAGLIFAIGEAVYSSLELIFAIFQKRFLFGIITFSFFEYKQSNAGEQHADVITR